MLYEILKPVAVLLVKLLFRIEIKGKEKIPQKGGFILASNHLSYLDPIILGVASPQRLYFLAKKELFTNKLFASLVKRLGAIPLKREKTEVSTFKTAIKILKENKPLVIFPQGKRSYQINELKKGVGFLFKKTEVPIIVAKIRGSEKVLPPGKKFIRLGKIKIKFASLKGVKREEGIKTICSKLSHQLKSL